MANSKKVRQKRIEKKYEKLISDTFDRLSSEGKTMGELWQELDKLKQQMKEDFKTAGIIVE
jgi:hypothetical protein